MAISLYAQNNQTEESTLDASTSAQEATSDWSFSGSAVFSSRPYEGGFSKTQTAGEVNRGMVATDDSMGLGDSNEGMYALGAKYKRWSAVFNYMPTNFEGTGTALIGSKDPGMNGALVESPLDTNINVKMYLANVSYDIIQTPNMIFGLGVGFGATSVEMSILPEDRPELAIDYGGTQPFGFLSMHMKNKYEDFLYGFTIRAIQANFQNVDVGYSDYKIDLGYRLIDDWYNLDAVGGYRNVTFDAALVVEGGDVASKMNLKGPFIGLAMSY